MSELALLGGKPVFDPPFDAGSIWPPVNDATAQRLQELYYSKQWSAFSGVERDFAQSFAEYHGAKYGIFTINGTVTMEVALGAYGIGPGDEVIVPPLTWFATAAAVRYVGACPVFVDIDPETLCIDPEKITAAITERTKAIIPVHAYGAITDMDRVMEIAKRHKLKVIEDAAHVHGGVWGGRKVGGIGDVGSFSFQYGKIMSCGEGGICITSDKDIAERMFRATHFGYGFDDKPRQAKVGPPPGLVCHNYRATAFQAGILEGQLETLDGLIERYACNVRYLEERLKQSTKIRFQKPGAKTEKTGRFGWPMIFDNPEYVDIPITIIQAALEREGALSLQVEGPMYTFKLFNYPPEEYRIPYPCKVTELVGARGLFLAHVYLGVDRPDIEKVADAIEKVALNADALRSYTRNSGVFADAPML